MYGERTLDGGLETLRVQAGPACEAAFAGEDESGGVAGGVPAMRGLPSLLVSYVLGRLVGSVWVYAARCAIRRPMTREVRSREVETNGGGGSASARAQSQLRYSTRQACSTLLPVSLSPFRRKAPSICLAAAADGEPRTTRPATQGRRPFIPAPTLLKPVAARTRLSSLTNRATKYRQPRRVL